MTSGYVFYTQLATKTSQATIYLAYGAMRAQRALEAEVRIPIAENTAKKLFIKVFDYTMKDIDSLPVLCTCTVRKNGVDTALTKTFSATGTFIDTDDVDFADEDEISIKVSTSPSYNSGSAVFAVGICFLLP